MSANGKLAASELIAVDGVQLAKRTAAAFLWMASDCAAATHVAIRIARPAGGYRSLAMQRGMRSNPSAYNVDPAMVPFLATPGSSTHGHGTAVDLTTATRKAASKWLLANCARYGFARPPAGDKNHFLHNGTAPAGGHTTPLPATTKDDPMDYRYIFTAEPGKTTQWALLHPELLPEGALVTKVEATAAAWSLATGETGVKLSAAAFTAAVDMAKALRRLAETATVPAMQLGEVTTDGSPIDAAQAKLIGEAVAAAFTSRKLTTTIQ